MTEDRCSEWRPIKVKLAWDSDLGTAIKMYR